MKRTIKPKVAVIGGGSWATAIVKILSEQESIDIFWWLRNESEIAHIKQFKHNPSYLSDVTINTKKVTPIAAIKDAVREATIVIIVVPAAFVKDALKKLTKEDLANKYIVSAVKGLIPEVNLLVTDFVQKKYDIPAQNVGIIAGPCHAEEVALEKQSYLTIASHHLPLAKEIAALFQGRYVKATPLEDVEGIEYCAIMKNIIALTCGIAHGLNYGDNFQAVLVSNAMLEIEDFLAVVCPKDRKLCGSAYLGDLLVTAYSQFSRNRTFGNMIGRGYSVKSAQVEMNMIAEGYYAVKSIYTINLKYKVKMPIATAAYRILYEKAPATQEIEKLKKGLT